MVGSSPTSSSLKEVVESSGLQGSPTVIIKCRVIEFSHVISRRLKPLVMHCLCQVASWNNSILVSGEDLQTQ
jgi:hypothetical protein